MLAELKSFHRQASQNAANFRAHRVPKNFDEDVDQSSERVLPDKIVESDIVGDFEVELLQSDG
jgi:hypothetical protein